LPLLGCWGLDVGEDEGWVTEKEVIGVVSDAERVDVALDGCQGFLVMDCISPPPPPW